MLERISDDEHFPSVISIHLDAPGALNLANYAQVTERSKICSFIMRIQLPLLGHLEGPGPKDGKESARKRPPHPLQRQHRGHLGLAYSIHQP